MDTSPTTPSPMTHTSRAHNREVTKETRFFVRTAQLEHDLMMSEARRRGQTLSDYARTAMLEKFRRDNAAEPDKERQPA